MDFNYTHYILDAAIIVVLLIFVAIGAKKGIIQSLGEFIGAVVSAWAASFCGGIIADTVYDRFFREAIINRINIAVGSGANGAAGYFKSLPDFIIRYLNGSGVTEESLSRTIENGTKNAVDVIEAAISPVFIGMIKVLAVVICFLVFMALAKLLVKLIAGIFELPVLKQINAVIGAAFGFLVGAVVIWVIIAAVEFFEPMMSESLRASVQSAVKSSVIYSAVSGVNPFEWIFR